MEAAFRADFSAVRIHEGPQAGRIGAIAFTAGSHIYFAPGRFQPHSSAGQQLLGHELAHVLQQRSGRVTNPFTNGVAVVQNPALEAEAERLGHIAAHFHAPIQAKAGARQLQTEPGSRMQWNTVLQRYTLVGTDPLNDLADPNSRSLSYGTSTARKTTLDRVGAHLNTSGVAARRITIDSYNQDIGLNNLIGAGANPTSIFKLREALADPNPVANWSNYLPNAIPNLALDPDLVAWINLLVAHRRWIGLEDLGGAGGKKKLGLTALSTRTRFKKNFGSEHRYDTRAVSRQDINDWLGPNGPVTHAQAVIDAANMTIGKRQDLGLWITKALWRRTSKLGITLTVSHGHTIHINMAGDKRFDPARGGAMNLRAGELKKVNHTYGRLITTSEYRHIKKGIKQGTIPAAQVNFYSEFN
jgi:hypothetical protein